MDEREWMIYRDCGAQEGPACACVQGSCPNVEELSVTVVPKSTRQQVERERDELREALEDAYKWLRRAHGAYQRHREPQRFLDYTKARKRAAEALSPHPEEGAE